MKGAIAKLYFNDATTNAGKTTMPLQASYSYRERGMTTMLFVAGRYRKGDKGLISSHRPRGRGRDGTPARQAL